MSNFIECKFPVDYKKNYYPNLFSWKELADLINVRPLMTEYIFLIHKKEVFNGIHMVG